MTLKKPSGCFLEFTLNGGQGLAVSKQKRKLQIVIEWVFQEGYKSFVFSLVFRSFCQNVSEIKKTCISRNFQRAFRAFLKLCKFFPCCERMRPQTPQKRMVLLFFGDTNTVLFVKQNKWILPCFVRMNKAWRL